jgi:PKD repeat protein
MKRLFLALCGILVLGLFVSAQNQPPVANAGDDRTAYTGQIISLAGSATDAENEPIFFWAWAVESAPSGANFLLDGDTTPNPLFTAYTPGDYLVLLVVGDANGTSLPDYITITVRDNLPPVAVATADKTTVRVGEAVTFNASSSYDPEGMPLTYFWDFGDGTPATTEIAPTHVYASQGTFTVDLFVKDERMVTDHDALEITVLPAENHPPTASPTALPTSGFAPLTVQFTANATDLDGDPLTYLWQFGDGATSTEANVNHTYGPGTFTAHLEVDDGISPLHPMWKFAISVSSAIQMQVDRVEVQMKGQKSSMGKVELGASVQMWTPGPSETVSAYFDGILLFSVPFSSFETKPNSPLVYQFRDQDIFVELDMEKGQLAVIRRNLSLSGIDLQNGADLEFRVGDLTAVENVLLTAGQGNRFVYPAPVVIK